MAAAEQGALQAAAIDLFMSSVIQEEPLGALIVAQEAAKQEDIDACPAGGPSQNECCFELAAKATVLSVLREVPCFRQLEASRLKRDKREAALRAGSFSRRFHSGHGWGTAQQQQQQQAADSGVGGSGRKKDLPVVEWSDAAKSRLQACYLALSQGKESRQKHYFRDAAGSLCRVPQKGVALGIGLVVCDEESRKTHFPDFERFRQACGAPLDGALEEWEMCVKKLREAHTRVIIAPGVKMQQCPTQARTITTSERLRSDAAATPGGELVERPAPLDLADAMKVGLTGLHEYVRSLYFNPPDLQCVEFLCQRIRAALDGGAGLEYYHLMDSARKSVNSLVKMHGPPEISAFPLPPAREQELKWWQCELTGKRLQDPVLAPDGRSFERNAIDNWLVDEQARSSRTDCPKMVDNLPLRDALTWLQQQGWPTSPAAESEITHSEAAAARENQSRATSASGSPKTSPDRPVNVHEPEIEREKEAGGPEMDSQQGQSPAATSASGSRATAPRSPGKRSGDNLSDAPGSSPSKRLHVRRVL